jgi:hypothetical protein
MTRRVNVIIGLLFAAVMLTGAFSTPVQANHQRYGWQRTYVVRRPVYVREVRVRPVYRQRYYWYPQYRRHYRTYYYYPYRTHYRTYYYHPYRTYYYYPHHNWHHHHGVRVWIR